MKPIDIECVAAIIRATPIDQPDDVDQALANPSTPAEPRHLRWYCAAAMLIIWAIGLYGSMNA